MPRGLRHQTPYTLTRSSRRFLTTRCHQLPDTVDAFIHRLTIGPNDDVRLRRLFVRVRDSCEMRDFSSDRTPVQSLRVACNERVDGGVDEDFPKRRARLFDALACAGARILVW